MRRLLSVTTVLILILSGVAPAQEPAAPEAPAEESLPPPLPPTPVVAQDAPNDQGDKVVVAWLPSADDPFGVLPETPLTSKFEPGEKSLAEVLAIDVERTAREWTDQLRRPVSEMLAEEDPVLRRTFEGYLAGIVRRYLDNPLTLARRVPDASNWLPRFATQMGLSPEDVDSLEPLARLLETPSAMKKKVENRTDDYLAAMRTAAPALDELRDTGRLMRQLASSPELIASVQTLLDSSDLAQDRTLFETEYTTALGQARLAALQKEAVAALRQERPDLAATIDAPKRQKFAKYLVERAPSPDGPWTPVASKGPGTTSITDGGPRAGIETGETYYYRVSAVGTQGGRSTSATASAVPETQWWYFGRTNNFWATGIFIALIVGWIWGAGKRFPKMAIIGMSVVCGLLAVAAWVSYGTPFNWAVAGAFVPPILASAVAKLGMRADKIYIRPIAGIQAVEEAIGRATEMGKPILYVPGLSTIEDIATLAALNILGPVAERAAEYDSRIIVPNRDPVVYTIAEEVVKESYLRAGRPDSFRSDDIYFVTGRQFAFAAAVNGLMLREKPATNFFLGMFWAESLLLAETGAMTGAIQIAGTDAVTQLPFFIVACDYTLIGEELYAAGAYMGRDPKLLGGLKGQDYNKAIVLLSLVAAALIFFVADLGGSRTAFLDLTHDAFQALFQVKN